MATLSLSSKEPGLAVCLRWSGFTAASFVVAMRISLAMACGIITTGCAGVFGGRYLHLAKSVFRTDVSF